MAEKTYPRVEDLGDMIVLRGELGVQVIYNGLNSDNCDHYEGGVEFLERFEIDSAEYLGDPTDLFYKVITFTRVIRRRSDGRLFGFSYDSSPGNDAVDDGCELEQDVEEFGIELEWNEEWEIIGGQPYVFLPVREFQRQGFEVLTP